jgi:hypothetical protein
MFIRRVRDSALANVFARPSDNSVAIVVGAKKIEAGDELVLAEYDSDEVIECDDYTCSQIPEDRTSQGESPIDSVDSSDDDSEGRPASAIVTSSKRSAQQPPSKHRAYCQTVEDDSTEDDDSTDDDDVTTPTRRRAAHRGKTTGDWEAWADNIARDMDESECYAVDLNDSKYSSFIDEDIGGFRTKRRMFGGKRLTPAFWKAMKRVLETVQVLRLPAGITLCRADMESLCRGATNKYLWGLNLGECTVVDCGVLATFAGLMSRTKIGWLYLDDNLRYLIKDTPVREEIARALAANREKSDNPMPSNNTTGSELSHKHGKWVSHDIPMAMNPIVSTGEQTKPHGGAAGSKPATPHPEPVVSDDSRKRPFVPVLSSSDDEAQTGDDAMAGGAAASRVSVTPEDGDDDARRPGGGAAATIRPKTKVKQGLGDTKDDYVNVARKGENTTVLDADAGDGLMISTTDCREQINRLQPFKKTIPSRKLLLYNKGPDYDVYVHRPDFYPPNHENGTTMYTTLRDVSFPTYGTGDHLSFERRLGTLVNLGFACMAGHSTRGGTNFLYLVPNCFVLCNDPKDAEWVEDRKQAYVQVCSFPDEMVTELCKECTPVPIKHPRLKRMMAVDALLVRKYVNNDYTGAPRRFPISSIDLRTEATDQMIDAEEMMLAPRPAWYLTNSSAAGPDREDESDAIAAAMHSPDRPEVKIGIAFWYDTDLEIKASDHRVGCPAYYGIVARKSDLQAKARALAAKSAPPADMQGLWLYEYTLPDADDGQADSQLR